MNTRLSERPASGAFKLLSLVCVTLGMAIAATPASAGELLSTTVTSASATERTCQARLLDAGAGYAQTDVSAPATGWVSARLSGDGGSDWDLAVFDRSSGELVAASANRGSDELAEGVVLAGEQLAVQACHRSGDAGSAALSVSSLAVDTSKIEKTSLVRVSVANRARMRELDELGLDLTEHGGESFFEVVLHGAADAEKLRDHKFIYTVEVPDLAAQSANDRAADRAYAASVQTSGLPSGRTGYRRLADYGSDMKQLAQDYPDLVRPITLPFKTFEGRPVEGIEIATNVNRTDDGRPVFLQAGLHHAREWPSGEHAMEWAFELVNGYKVGNDRVRRLVESTRTIVVPVVNPDGFNISREAGQLYGRGGGNAGPDTTVEILAHPYEYRRKNCRLLDAEAGSCLSPALGIAAIGVDPNRNYGGFWGGPGASADPTNETYYGPGPFSEAETKNLRDLMSKRQVTTLITNHTFSNLVLRPPGVQAQGESVDESSYKALGDAMAAENGYASQHGYQLYDTTGTTEDWSYYATGGFGFTYEIGPNTFHPTFAKTVAEYEGTTDIAKGGNREAYFIAQEWTADASKHSLISGKAPKGAVLRLKKSFRTPTSQEDADGSPKTFEDTLDTTLHVPASGRYEWHINPSTRPLVAQEYGRVATGPPSDPITFSGDASTADPCGDFDTEDEACWNDHPFTVPSAGVDNASATVRIDWLTPASDWDMKVFRDSNGDGSSVGETEVVGSSADGTTNTEETTFSEPVLKAGEKYVVRVINWVAAEPYTGKVTFAGPEPYQAPQKESWTLTCESSDGKVLESRQVTIDRGQRQRIDLRCGGGRK